MHTPAVHPVMAIVFDANVFGRNAEPNLDTIARWAGACLEHDAELWIPEIVVDELAQHAVETSNTFLSDLRSHNRRRREWGFPPIAEPKPFDEHDVRNAIEATGARVIELAGEDAVAALKDQVLQRGVGSRKKGTKTGASDSAWVRSVLRENGGDTRGLIVVTGDTAALISTCEELEVDPPRRAKHLGEIHALLEPERPISNELRERFRQWALGLFDLSDPDIGYLKTLAQLDRRSWWSPPTDREFNYEWEHQDSFLELEDVEVVGDPVFDSWSSTLSGVIRFRCRVEDQFARQDAWGDYPEYSALHYPGVITVVASVFVTDTGLEFDDLFDDVALTNPKDTEVTLAQI